MISAPDRRKTVELINEARDTGARLEPACRVVGICSRTYQRWTWEGEIKTDGRPTAKRPEPSNKLTKKEIDQVLSVCHDPKYGSLPPGQIVPRLADQGVYIASESSFTGFCTKQENKTTGAAVDLPENIRRLSDFAPQVRIRFGPGTSHGSLPRSVACIFICT